MVAAKLTDEQFRQAWIDSGGRAAVVALQHGYTNVRGIYDRRNYLERKHGWHLPSAGLDGKIGRGDAGAPANEYLKRHTIDGFTGVCVVFSDAHYHPGIGSTVAHRAMLEVIRDLKPRMIIANGDIFDGARLSRFPRNGWEEQPRVSDELEEVQERMAEIRHACRSATLIRTNGNHDIRYDRHLSTHASDLEGVQGMRLADHLPAWKECMSVFINGHTMVKHRFSGGIHAAYNNTLRAGTNMVTGHTHYLEVKPWGDYRGRRYGVQTGTLAEPNSPAFSYIEDAPTAWCSGFVVLTFDRDQRLLHPEIAEVIDQRCFFRGQVIVDGRKKARAA